MIQFPNKIYVDKHLQQALPGKKQIFVKYIELVNKYSKEMKLSISTLWLEGNEIEIGCVPFRLFSSFTN